MAQKDAGKEEEKARAEAGAKIEAAKLAVDTKVEQAKATGGDPLAAQAEGEQQVHDLEVITEHVITTVHDEGEAIINVARRVDDAQKASDANVNSIKRASKADIDEARVNGADAESLAIVNAVQKVS
jgi:nucleoside diphosphate kinase